MLAVCAALSEVGSLKLLAIAALAARMKANRQHRAPLCRRALKILDEAQASGEGAGSLVFTRGTGNPLDDKQLLRRRKRNLGMACVMRVLDRSRLAATQHGLYEDKAVEPIRISNRCQDAEDRRMFQVAVEFSRQG